jgi:hypothetical protein
MAGREKPWLVEEKSGRVTDQRQAKPSRSEREREEAIPHPSGGLSVETVVGPIHE